MKIKKKMIVETAEMLFMDHRKISQVDVQNCISKKLGRGLSKGEKIRVTLILRGIYRIVRIKRKSPSGERIIWFEK